MPDPDLSYEYEIYDNAASVLRLLAEPMRLRILVLLREKECCVNELVEKTGAGQANISKHLSILKRKGVVSRRKEGLFAYYFISDTSIFTIYDCIINVLKK